MKADLLLHQDIYQEASVIQAIQDFRRLAHIKLKHQGDYFVCAFSRCVYEKETTIHEFSNYVIDLMNNVVLE